jgi:hypothetical protein
VRARDAGSVCTRGRIGMGLDSHSGEEVGMK